MSICTDVKDVVSEMFYVNINSKSSGPWKRNLIKKFGIIFWSKTKKPVKKCHCLQQRPKNCNNEKNSDDRNARYKVVQFQAPRTTEKAEEQEIQ